MTYRVKVRLKEILDEYGITQKNLSKMTGLRESTISDIVRGTRTGINFDHLSKIITALQIDDINRIMTIENREEKSSRE